MYNALSYYIQWVVSQCEMFVCRVLPTMSRHALVCLRVIGALIGYGGGAYDRCRCGASVGYGGVRAGRSARRLAADAVSAVAVRWYVVALRPDASGDQPGLRSETFAQVFNIGLLSFMNDESNITG
ncbi:uncharacterized protein LOC118647303 [Monomorium pharaonis]|uniref:uncharacterized protein LOC118647303 n=1 Tax=Monomorium pharaonis TaxID=307658 RepID=UPI0017471C67|nr:uncharacterized protein LOC118647303 [Monomorium pharaonis]